MAVVFLTSGEEILALDATTEVNLSRSNQVTKSSVMSGKTASDGVVSGNKEVTFSGVCTYQKVNGGNTTPPNPLELQVLLDKMIESETRFIFYGNTLIPNLSNVVIRNVSIGQSNKLDSVVVSLTVEQVFITTAAQKTTIYRPTVAAADEIPEKSEEVTGKKTTEVESDSINWYTVSLASFGGF